MNNCTIQHRIRYLTVFRMDMRYNFNYDVEIKIFDFQNIYGTILRTPKRKVRRNTSLNFYTVLDVPTLL